MSVADSINRLLAVCASQIGYYRKPGTRTKFGEWYGLPTGQWCAMFLSWAADQSGTANVTPKHAYTPSGVNWFKARGQWHAGRAGIRRGDWVYFDFPGAPNRVSHVAIVESVNSDGSVNTIEGNTSGPTGDQRNGGACLRKRRSSYIVGYGRPNYSGSSPEAPVRNYLQRGDTGAGVRLLQERLIASGYGVGSAGADGDFGAATEAAVKAFQRANGLDDDGIVGAQTNAKLAPTPSAPPAPVFHGTPGAHTGKLTADGNLELVVDGNLGSATIARWQQVMGTTTDGRIDDEGSSLITADQHFLNSVVDRTHIRNLTGRYTLVPDGSDGPRTRAVRQFWLRNAVQRGHQINLIGRLLDFDGVFGEQSVRVLQFALNHATAGSRRYGQV